MGSRQLHVLAGDQAGAALVGQVQPQPIDRNRQPAAKADQIIDVRDAPDQPGEPASEAQPAEIDNRFFTADRRETTHIPIPERTGRRLVGEPRFYHPAT